MAALGVGVTVAGAAAAPRARLWLYDQGWEPYSRLVSPRPAADSRPGPLDEADLAALLAATEVILGYPVQMAHYEALFRWRAENQSGYRARYQRFRASLDRAAVEDTGRGFAECDRPTREKLLEKLSLTVPLAKVDRSRLVLGEREWEQFHTYIAREVLRLFSKTDALIAIGYDSWPGTPRGLENYQRAPAR